MPGPEGVERVRQNAEKGVHQRLFTNSLATNDVAAVHAGYARYRKDLLRNGMEIYELRPDASSARKKWALLAGSSKASLHTKVAVIDGTYVVVGSFNLDPRSESINTEIVIKFESEELAQEILTFMAAGMKPENSYRVVLEVDDSGYERLVWITEEDGEEVRFTSEPEVSFWRRFQVWLTSLLPIEDHL